MPHHLTTSILFTGALALEWEDSPLAPDADRSRLEKLLLDSTGSSDKTTASLWLIILGLSDPATPLSPALSFWRTIATAWLHQVRTDPEAEAKREVLTIPLDADLADSFCKYIPPMIGSDRINETLLFSIWAGITAAFASGIVSFKGSFDNYFDSLSPKLQPVDRIHFHLVENRNNEQRPFAFLATYSTRIDSQGRTRHQPLKHAFEEFAGNSGKMLELLATVNKVAKSNKLLASMVDSGDLFKVVGLTPEEAYIFLEGVATFETAGILCRIPRWWKNGARKAAVTLSLGNNKPSRVGVDALLDFSRSLSIDGEPLTKSEARKLLERAESLVFIKGRWIPVNLESLKKTLDAFKNAEKLVATELINFEQAMRMLMRMKADGVTAEMVGAEIECGGWLKSVIEKMTNPTLIRQTTPAPGLKATLRHYQQTGLNWLGFMHSLGFGVCLADDMGLGKTVQMLAHLQKLKKKGRTSLIIVPASLLENWRSEIEKFTPDITFILLHPQINNALDFDSIGEHINRYDCVITTYGMISRCAWISKYEWFYIICDEAQAIKNPMTAQTRAVKALTSAFRCAMTGTPVENRLTDLWSIFDFINPGLLGSFSVFKSFVKHLDEHPDGFGKLRIVVHPYILRRSKTDKTIISDLPDKVELKTWCTLSKQQSLLYERLVEKLDNEISRADGIKRKGIILGYLMRFKQLCNHPDHYAGNGDFLQEQSGKFERLTQLCSEIHERREKMLLFTQFAEIISPLSRFLETLFGTAGVTLSGSTSVKQRREAVEQFQSDAYVPFFILSLKAGGVGLNLPAANHVVHFDRWWNPAVENQATDRAFRIGQKKNVMVHKFICKGTIEEKIDALIDDKKQLAAQIIPTGNENWITELDDKRIKEMFRLTIDANVDK